LQREISQQNDFNPVTTKPIYVIERFSAYRAVNTLQLGYKNQPVCVVWRKSCCLFWVPLQNT